MLATGCQTGPAKLGETFTEKDPMSVDAVVQALKAGETLTGVQLAGKIDKNCMEKGCWLSMMSSDGSELLMTFKDEAFTIPINSVGRQIVVLGDARAVTDTVEGKPETSYEFECTGLMFK